MIGGTRTLVFVAALLLAARAPLTLVPQQITLATGSSFEINVPEGFAITVAAQGLSRVRFLARSPDNRIFVTDMKSRADNSQGVVYILEGFDEANGKFSKVIPYLSGLRNPNSIAFHTDAAGSSWLYLALTHQLVRYAYTAGDIAPASTPQVLATFPDYGLSYKYGGWHLTRTIAIGPNQKIYVSVGSSCNACEEKEAVRASIIEMDLDGANQRPYATGLRNAVGMRWVGERLFVTNMGSDHLGDDRPSDTFERVRPGANYGWPYCYPVRARLFVDPRFSSIAGNPGCRNVPRSTVAFGAHSSPLGFDHFDESSDATLRNAFVVALHGASKLALARGYRLALVREGAAPVDMVTGFLQGRRIYGRPTDVLKTGPDAFLFSDDHAGVIYYLAKKR